jgi:hypothetical protein
MGTVQHVSGEIIFEPPLCNADLNDPRLARYVGVDPTADDAPAVRLHISNTVTETPDGTLTARSANTIMPTWPTDGINEGYYGNRRLARDLADLVRLVDQTWHPGPGDRTWTGTMESYTDVSHPADFDAYRLTIGTAAGGPAVYRTNARIVWDDEPARYLGGRFAPMDRWTTPEATITSAEMAAPDVRDMGKTR